MDIATLERAAETFLAPPNVVSAEDRKAAELAFTDLKIHLSLDAAQQIMGVSQHPFVLFQVGQVIGEVVLRDWALLEPPVVEAAYRMLVQFVAEQASIPQYVVGEYLRSAAMIIKRGSVDDKTGDPEKIYALIHGMLSHQEARMQSIGVQLISAMCDEFCSAWRNSKFSITWDFHLNAKKKFEQAGLLRLLEMSIQTLHSLASNSDIVTNEFERRLTTKFLEAVECIFSWNFSSRFFRRIFAPHTSSLSFRPPQSWSHLIEDDNFYLLFFKLHHKVRSDESLATHSMQCLVQLASISGGVLVDTAVSQKYVNTYVRNLLELFSDGPLPHERHHLCVLLNRLFLYRPLQSLMRLPDDLRTRFFSYVAQFMEHLTGAALHLAISRSDHSEQASLALLLDSWCILLRGKWLNALPEEETSFVQRELVGAPTWRILLAFFASVQAPPAGNRPVEEGGGGDQDGEEEENHDDRTVYSDVLSPMCGFACYSIVPFMEMMTNTMRERLAEFARMAEGAADASRLPAWQEDMHWLMLVYATSLVGEDIDGTCHIQCEVIENSVHLCEAKGSTFSTETRNAFLRQCIENPTASRVESAGLVDPFVIMIGELLAWSSLEHQLVTSASPEMVSPELCRSTAFALRRVLNAASHLPDSSDEHLPFDESTVAYAYLPLDGECSDLLVRFALEKCFTLLHKLNGEKKLCAEAVGLLGALVESRSASLASSPSLFALLGSLDLAACPVRGELMRVLVLIGAAANDADLQKNMFVEILEPLSRRFKEVCTATVDSPAGSSSTEHLKMQHELVDLLQCFDGVARASQAHSAYILFRVMEPVLETCAALVRTSQSAAVVTAVLTLIQNVTTKISIYIDNETDSAKLYTSLLSTVDAYRATHGSRFIGMSSDDEEKAADLVLFMEILSNVLSKDILEYAEDRQLTGSKVAMTSLEMLMCVMNESLLQHPEVVTRFYRLILYLVEFCPESLTVMTEQLLHSMCACLSAGLTSKFGTEITSVCLETLSGVASFFTENRHKANEDVIKQLHLMLPMVFEACLENSCEASLFSEAVGSLYALICFDQAFFDSFVRDLLSSKSNATAASKLQTAFAALFPEPPQAGRRERIAFRGRMETFLNEIQGLLWMH